MAETLKEKEDRLRREAEAKARTGGDTSFVAVNTLPKKETTTATTGMKETARTEGRSTTEKIGETLHEVKEDVKEAVTPGRTETEQQRMEDERRRAAVGTTAGIGTAAAAGKAMSRPGVKIETKETEKGPDWEQIQHPGMESCGDEPYGTRPVSDLTPPTDVKDKADLAAVRMMEREKADREKMDRDRIMTTATTDAAAARAAMTSKEMTPAEIEAERERMKAGAGEGMAPAGTQGQHWRGEPWAKNPKVGGKETAEAEAEAARGRMMTGPAVAGAAAMTPAETEAERERERTRAAATGAALVGAPPTHPVVKERPMTGTVVPPGVTTTTPLKTYGTVVERSRMHAEDPSVHTDWETQPQINAPRDVGIPTAEGQADAARIREGGRRSDETQEPRIDRRGGDYEVPAASGARTGPMREKARDTKEESKAKERNVKEDVDRKI